jgi:hypothetical protein
MEETKLTVRVPRDLVESIWKSFAEISPCCWQECHWKIRIGIITSWANSLGAGLSY